MAVALSACLQLPVRDREPTPETVHVALNCFPLKAYSSLGNHVLRTRLRKLKTRLGLTYSLNKTKRLNY
jgi:hypothetical protein